MTTFPCPFVYANGKRCTGHIVRVEAYGADLSWQLEADGTWSFGFDYPRSHLHMFCSEHGNHAGYGRADADAMKAWPDKLPEGLSDALWEAAKGRHEQNG